MQSKLQLSFLSSRRRWLCQDRKIFSSARAELSSILVNGNNNNNNNDKNTTNHPEDDTLKSQNYALLSRQSRYRGTTANNTITTTASSTFQRRWLTAETTADTTTPEEQEQPHPTEIQYHMPPPPPLEEESLKKVDELFAKVLWLDMVEVHLLTQLIHEQLGVKWSDIGAAPSGGGISRGGSSSSAGEADQEQDNVKEEKTTRDVKLVGFDAKAKIKVIKEVRAIAGLGLKEAKELVEAAPKVIQKDLKIEKAEELKARLEEIGATVEIL